MLSSDARAARGLDVGEGIRGGEACVGFALHLLGTIAQGSVSSTTAVRLALVGVRPLNVGTVAYGGVCLASGGFVPHEGSP